MKPVIKMYPVAESLEDMSIQIRAFETDNKKVQEGSSVIELPKLSSTVAIEVWTVNDDVKKQTMLTLTVTVGENIFRFVSRPYVDKKYATECHRILETNITTLAIELSKLKFVLNAKSTQVQTISVNLVKEICDNLSSTRNTDPLNNHDTDQRSDRGRRHSRFRHDDDDYYDDDDRLEPRRRSRDNSSADNNYRRRFAHRTTRESLRTDDPLNNVAEVLLSSMLGDSAARNFRRGHVVETIETTEVNFEQTKEGKIITLMVRINVENY